MSRRATVAATTRANATDIAILSNRLKKAVTSLMVMVGSESAVRGMGSRSRERSSRVSSCVTNNSYSRVTKWWEGSSKSSLCNDVEINNCEKSFKQLKVYTGTGKIGLLW